MKKIIFSFSLCCSSLFSFAQSSSPNVIASGGGFATGAGFTNSFTVGQGSLPETFSTGTFIITQGFQQPADVSAGFAPASDLFSFGGYPNPTTGDFFLEYDLKNSSDITIEVVDIVGQIVYRENFSSSAGHQMHSIDISGNANGIYFVRCSIHSEATLNSSSFKITLAH